MSIQDWLVTEDGKYQGFEINTEIQPSPYRLYRFLTDLEDLLETHPSDQDFFQSVRPLVRRLLTSSNWLQFEFLEPDPATGWSVLMLYDEPDFPLTIQTVVWNPGIVSPIHNHGTWGVVAILSGQEKNRFWKAKEDADASLDSVGELILNPGEIITFLPNSIHSVEAIGDEPVISFNLYGETDYDNRFEFDLKQGTKTIF